MILKWLVAGLSFLLVVGDSPPSPKALEDSPTVQVTILKKIDPQPIDLSWEQQQEAFNYGLRSIAEQCKNQPTNLWCSNFKLEEKTLDAWKIMNTSLNIKSKFHYVSDTIDNWRVHSGTVLLDRDWYGDCDDLTSTSLDILVRNGQPLDKIWFLLVDVQHTSTFDHLIGMVKDDRGHFWIVGDTSSQNSYPVDQLKYRVVAVARGDHALKWEDPHLLGAFPVSTLQSNPIAMPIVTGPATKPQGQ